MCRNTLSLVTDLKTLFEIYFCRFDNEKRILKKKNSIFKVVNGEVDKKDDSGNETGAGEHEVEEEGGYAGVGYDKTKSFFDNISCEAATDRTKGKGHKDWHQERKINSETFGVSARRGG